MKILILIIPAFFFVSTSVVQAQTKSAEAELTQLLHDFMKGASVNDVQMHDRFWAENLIYTSSSGNRFGKEQIMEGLRKADGSDAETASTAYSAEDIQIQVYGNVAVVAFRLVGKTETGVGIETAHYLNSGTFLKTNGQWKVVNWQATKVPE